MSITTMFRFQTVHFNNMRFLASLNCMNKYIENYTLACKYMNTNISTSNFTKLLLQFSSGNYVCQKVHLYRTISNVLISTENLILSILYELNHCKIFRNHTTESEVYFG